jgi:hypothetical protein
MKPFEFVLVIISIIIGLAFTAFADTFAFMIKNYRISIFSLPYLSLMCMGLIGGLNYWATVYMHRKITEWSSLSMGLLFLTALTYYAIAGVFFPDPVSFDHNYVELYHEVIGPSLAMMICFVFSLTIESYVLKKGRPLKWYVMMLLFSLLALSGIIVDDRIFREVLSFILLALQVFNLTINSFVISERSSTDDNEPIHVNE